MIPPEKIEDIKSASDIVEVLSEYLELKKSGSNFKARCPFHGEKTASFMVSPDKQIFHCFGCGAGGNVFTFIQKQENLNFVEAVRLLARRSGIQIEEQQYTGGKFDEKEKIIAINKAALEYFRENLKKNTAAMDYIIKRGITQETVDEFMLGYAPSGSGLFTLLKSKGYSEELIYKAWICKKGDSGSGYDVFRNRIIFPILNVYNDPVAFGARVLDDSLPKYINSAETPAYSKGKNLYNLNNARKHAAESINITEGYMDTIAMYSAGFKNTAASLGTALTPDQARLLKRYTQKAYLIYDMDDAGKAGAVRGGDNLFEAGIDAGVVSFEGAKDPDEFIKKFGAEEFKKRISSAVPFFEFRAQRLAQEGDIKNPYYKEKAAREIASLIAKAESPVVRRECIKKVSLLFDIPEGIIEQYVSGKEKQPELTPAPEVKKPAGMKEKGRESAERLIAVYALCAFERDDRDVLLRHLTNKRELLGISHADFLSALYSGVLKKTEELYSSGEKNVLSRLQIDFAQDNDAVAFIADALSRDVSKIVTEDLKNMIDDCLSRILGDKVTEKLKELQAKIRQAEAEKDFEKVKELIKEKQEIQNILSQRGEQLE
ncbi:MAG TPA: DNA primase [Candidatus Goldiibacteriota bacterium]|nr:DNA primase [Candidatus Goldiibacteriota bacterium]HPN63629.1 DNA primase [Candidatus Goldiibacteriota bacterium]HRQ43057.1 DNA primase [Candidatus Goldiibacteriota bacterium]